MKKERRRARVRSFRRPKEIYHPVYRTMIDRLVRARRRKQFTQKDVAHAMGAGRQWVSKIELCEVRLDVISFLRMCRLYKIPATGLVRWMEKEVARIGRLFFRYRILSVVD